MGCPLCSGIVESLLERAKCILNFKWQAYVVLNGAMSLNVVFRFFVGVLGYHINA